MSGLKRIHLHWSAGGYHAGPDELTHYHFVIDGDGREHAGHLPPEANIATGDGEYVAHTRGANTGAIGIAVCAMAGAVERPFNAGRYPMTHVQIDALCRLAARLAIKYGIPVRRDTVLTHAEVQRTLGAPQRGKWDITWLPGMELPGDAIEVGDMLRAKIQTMKDAWK